MDDEILDLVDRDDRVIAQAQREDIMARGLTNFRVVNGFLRNAQGAVFIPRRLSTKRYFPDALDVSVGGHVGSGETYIEALVREAEEELGLTTCDWREVAALTPPVHGISAFMRVYILDTDETPRFNPEDFSGAEWLMPRDILRRIHTGDKAKGDLAALVRICLLDHSY